MAFDDLTALADDELKQQLEGRKERIARVQRGEKDAGAQDALGTLGFVERARKAGKLPAPGMQKEYDQLDLLRQHRQKRAQAQLDDAETNLPTREGVLRDLLGEGGAAAAGEPAGVREAELKTDPRGRADRLSQQRDALLSQFGRGPAKPAAGGEAPIMEGTDAQGNRAFTNRADSGFTGLHTYAPSADGGSLSTVASGSGPSTREQARSALLAQLGAQVEEAKSAPLTRGEMGDMRLRIEPKYDEMAASQDIGYEGVTRRIEADPDLSPAHKEYLQKKYDKLWGHAAGQAASGQAADAYGAFRTAVDSTRIRPLPSGEAGAAQHPTTSAADDVEGAKQDATDQLMGGMQSGPGTTLPPDPRDLLLNGLLGVAGSIGAGG